MPVLFDQGRLFSLDWIPLFLDCLNIAPLSQHNRVVLVERLFADLLVMKSASGVKGLLRFLFGLTLPDGFIDTVKSGVVVHIDSRLVLPSELIVDKIAVLFERKTLIVIDGDPYLLLRSNEVFLMKKLLEIRVLHDLVDVGTPVRVELKHSADEV